MVLFKNHHSQVNMWLIDHMMRDKFNDPDIVYTTKDVAQDVKTTLDVTFSYRTTYRAISVALASRCGLPEESYANLLSYCAKFKRLNSGSRLPF